MAERPKADPHPCNLRKLLTSATCPHCWGTFPPEDVLWIAESPDLTGDRKLGENERVRFLPTQFDDQGFALDADGYPCRENACPRCHLRLPQGNLEAPPLFLSIVGAPASGKSYYLASSTFELRKRMARDFLINFTDADALMNQRVRDYENKQFFSGDRYVQLEKTEKEGDLYNMVKMGDQQIIYPQPFVFTAHPTPKHPNAENAETVARTICLYDNAGESYLPVQGADSADSPVTRHLAKSSAIFFVFDPTQDPRFRSECLRVSNDPQIQEDYASAGFRRSPQRQEAVLNEMVRRVRAYLRMRNTELYKKPLVIIVGKYDVWRPLIDSPQVDLIVNHSYNGRRYNWLALKNLQSLSAKVRDLLLDKTPEFVAAAESFAKEVVYIPTSATGVSPTVDLANAVNGFRSIDLKPQWCEIPMLYAIARTAPGLVPIWKN